MGDDNIRGHDDEVTFDRPAGSPRQWSSEELLEGCAEAIIMHAGETYRLRCTRNNKLILTK